MDNSQQKHDRWMSRYTSRSEANYKEYQEIFEENKSLLIKINNGVKFSTNCEYNEAINEFDSGIEIGDKLLSQDNLIDEVELAKAYMNRGIAYEHLGNGVQTICDKRKSVEMLEKLRSDDNLENLEDKYILALAYMNRGVTYYVMGNYGMAIADGKQSKDILEQLKQKEKDVSSDYAKVIALIGMAETKRKSSNSSEMEELNMAIKEAKKKDDGATLASILTIRGLKYIETGDFLRAISDFDDAIEMMECIDKFDQNELATAYAGRGMAHFGNSELKLSIPDFQKSIEIWEHLKKDGKFVDENTLSMAYSTIGMVLNETNVISDDDNVDEALSNYNKSIETTTNKRKDIDKQIDENKLAHAYMCKGVSFDQKEDYLEANKHYNEAIEIWERLDKKGIEIDNIEFAKAYMNRGANYYQTGENDKALANYHQCINIIEQLKKIGVEQDAFDMVMAYKNRGRAYEVNGNFKEAIDDNITALKIIKKVFRNQPELQEEYYGTLIEIMELVVNNNDQELFNNVIEEFLYSMRYVPKTAEAEEIQNNILEKLE